MRPARRCGGWARPLAGLLLVLGLAGGADAQGAQKHTLSGYVEDASSGEKLIGAVLHEPDLRQGTTTNRYGFFSLTLPAGSLRVVVSHIGYQSDTLATRLEQDQQLNIALEPKPLEMETVEVRAERLDPIQQESRMSVVQVPVRQIKSAPVLMGEVDVLKTLQLLPGVQSGAEGMSGLYVRGGSPDQNLILLDDAPVYNVSHLFGFFSVFNANAVKNVQLTKAGFPARYGGRLSSVLEIDMKDGNMKEFEAEGSVGLIASQLTVQGPLRKDRTSFILSGRRTYADLLARPFLRSDDRGGYHFYDVNAKVNHIFSPRSRVYLSWYGGDDRFWSEFEDDGGGRYREEKATSANFGWGNVTSTLRWNYLFSNRLFGNLTAIFSRYQLTTNVDDRSTVISDGDRESETLRLRYLSGIRDWGLKLDLDYIPDPAHYIRVGGSGTLHTYRPGAAQIKFNPFDGAPEDTTLTAKVTDALEYSLYGEDDVHLTDRLKANLGLHTSGFLVDDEVYTSLQPRLSMRYLLPSDWAVKASYAQMAPVHPPALQQHRRPAHRPVAAGHRARAPPAVGAGRRRPGPAVEGAVRVQRGGVLQDHGRADRVPGGGELPRGLRRERGLAGQGRDGAGLVVRRRAVPAEEARPHHRLGRLHPLLDPPALRPVERRAVLPLPLRPPPRRLPRPLPPGVAFPLALPHLGLRDGQRRDPSRGPVLQRPQRARDHPVAPTLPAP